MDTVQEELKRFKRDTSYYEAHHQELLDQYPEQWVAIYEQRVVGTGPDFEELLGELKSKGFSVGQVLVEYLTLREDLLILLL